MLPLDVRTVYICGCESFMLPGNAPAEQCPRCELWVGPGYMDPVSLYVRPEPHEARGRFLAGTGNLTAGEVRAWALELGEAVHEDGEPDETVLAVVVRSTVDDAVKGYAFERQRDEAYAAIDAALATTWVPGEDDDLEPGGWGTPEETLFTDRFEALAALQPHWQRWGDSAWDQAGRSDERAVQATSALLALLDAEQGIDEAMVNSADPGRLDEVEAAHVAAVRRARDLTQAQQPSEPPEDHLWVCAVHGLVSPAHVDCEETIHHYLPLAAARADRQSRNEALRVLDGLVAAVEFDHGDAEVGPRVLLAMRAARRLVGS